MFCIKFPLSHILNYLNLSLMKIYANIIKYPAKIFIQSQFMNDLYLSSSARFAQTKIFCIDKTWLIIAILREQHFIFNPIYLTTTFWHYKIYFNTLGDVMMIKLSRSFSFQDWAVPAYRSWYYSIIIISMIGNGTKSHPDTEWQQC